MPGLSSLVSRHLDTADAIFPGTRHHSLKKVLQQYQEEVNVNRESKGRPITKTTENLATEVRAYDFVKNRLEAENHNRQKNTSYMYNNTNLRLSQTIKNKTDHKSNKPGRKFALKLPSKTKHVQTYENITINDPSILKLRDMGVSISESEMNKIPTWAEITDHLGKEPVILGLETCEAYRKAVAAKDRYVAPTGQFNTGTNLLPIALDYNCQLPRKSKLATVPWGKHNLVQARLDGYRINKTQYDNYRNEDVLPVVMVRHPLSWMFSTCVHSYSAHWAHTLDNCPHLTNGTSDGAALNPVHMKYGYHPPNQKYHRYDSLIHMWLHWYQGYSKPDLPFPRLVVRLEDLVYHPDKVVKSICTCAGGRLRHSKVYMPEESVKVQMDRSREKKGMNGTLANGRETAGFLKAWIDHASTGSLWQRMTPMDQHFLLKMLRDDPSNQMKLFHYKI
ncbi:expressed unknown protein [Seminavis robusta]|uniref:Uncharacterized protein n=1 Tax=Seminavis robusta TaxID=568900 RepID=A0A9N8E933_9STRA|nr:expressed unknown protein [Seminavis robusta]|eukprot:Sro791_g203020.1 n/a (448) ;mRNA; f:37527-38870